MMADDDGPELPPRRNPGPPPFANPTSPYPANEDAGGIEIPPLRESAEEAENRRASTRSRLSSFLLAAVMGAILMGGAFWWGFEVGQQNALEQVPPIVRADLSPIKQPPEDPGGLQVPHQDKLVLRDAEEDNGVEQNVTLAPTPEQPAPPPPRVVETDAAGNGETDAAGNADTDTGTGVEATQLPPPPAIRSDESAAPARPAPAAPQPQTQAAAPPPPPSPSADGTATADSQTQTAAAPTPAAEPPAATPPPQPQATAPQQQAAAPAAASGAFRVQLAAYRTPEAAQTGWRALQGRHEDLLGALEPTVVRVDLGERGVFHRLQAGPYNDSAAANAACTALRARDQACLVVRP